MKGFLSGLGPWRIKASGNYGQKVSSPTWGHGVSKRQETMGKKFPLRLGAMAYHGNRKLWTKGFLSGLGPWRIMATGNYGQKVSFPAWGHGVSKRQETMGKKFPLRRGAVAYHGNRKLWQKVSSPAWGRGVSKRQETMDKRLPVRLGAAAFHHVPSSS